MKLRFQYPRISFLKLDYIMSATVLFDMHLVNGNRFFFRSAGWNGYRFLRIERLSGDAFFPRYRGMVPVRPATYQFLSGAFLSIPEVDIKRKSRRQSRAVFYFFNLLVNVLQLQLYVFWHHPWPHNVSLSCLHLYVLKHQRRDRYLQFPDIRLFRMYCGVYVE